MVSISGEKETRTDQRARGLEDVTLRSEQD